MQTKTPYELRVSRGFHLVRHLSDACGVQACTIRKYERGDLKREDELVHNAFEKIANALGVTKVTYAVAVRARVEAKLNAGKAN